MDLGLISSHIMGRRGIALLGGVVTIDSMTFDIQSVSLPKWPALVVVGERITPTRAKEILVRTDSWALNTNDRDWRRQIYQATGLIDTWSLSREPTVEMLQKAWVANDAWRSRHGVLGLNYLHNSRIASSYIGGTHGWCDWSGRIGCDNYNIGKYPSVEEVLEDWQRIAEAFPYLHIRSQLFDGEVSSSDTHHGGGHPLVEFVIKGGVAIAQAPTDRMLQPDTKDDDVSSFVSSLLLGNHLEHERGCILETLIDALEHVRKCVPSPKTSP